MRITVDLPEELINEAMKLTKCSTEAELIISALDNLIISEKIKELKRYYGKVPLDIDLYEQRSR